MDISNNPNIYHFVHYDRLSSIVEDGFLWSDSFVRNHSRGGTTIGMRKIKDRRLLENTLDSHTDLYVGQCVPFYFCPRSVMLFMLNKGNDPELEYRGGQAPLIHLESDFITATQWADRANLRWAFTTSNAGSKYYEDYSSSADLDKIDWEAVNARHWKDCKDKKMAEFLIEEKFPFDLVIRIGVISQAMKVRVDTVFAEHGIKRQVDVKPDWYY